MLSSWRIKGCHHLEEEVKGCVAPTTELAHSFTPGTALQPEDSLLLAVEQPTLETNFTDITVSWKKVEGAVSYVVKVQCKRHYNCCGECHGFENTTEIASLKFEGDPATNYIVTVQGRDEGNNFGPVSEPAKHDTKDTETNEAEAKFSSDKYSVNVEWPYECPYTGSASYAFYHNGIRQFSKFDTSTCISSATVGDLSPYTNYTFMWTTHNCDNKICNCNCTEKIIQTLPAAPSVPRDLNATQPPYSDKNDKYSRFSCVTWKEPEHINGVLKHYKLTYGASNSRLKPVIETGHYPELGCFYVELEPETNYHFSLEAENEEPKGEPSEQISCQMTTRSGIPFFKDEYPLINVVDQLQATTTQIILETSFISNDHGIVRKCEVWIEKCLEKVSNDNHHKNLVYCESPFQKKGAITINIGVNGEEQHVSAGEDCGHYSNPPLEPDTCYVVIAIIYTTDHSLESPNLVFQTKSSETLFHVFVSLLVILIVVMIPAGAVVYFRYYRPMQRSMTPELPFVLAVPPDVSVERRILLSDLPSVVERLLSEGQLGLRQEYAELRTVSPTKPTKNAALPANQSKNRYANIHPFDETRVVLKERRGIPCSDYINASYIHGRLESKQFIASQGPKKRNIEDFWRMVWEKNVHIIVMVTQCIEGNKDKCSKYWPDDGEVLTFESIKLKVKNLQEEAHTESGFIIHHLQLWNGHCSRSIVHFHFISWPDMGCPATPDHLISFVETVKNAVLKRNSTVVVHCSAGVGRTGTFIGLSNLMEEIKEQNNSIDVFHAVYRMRLHRTNMVQTEAQYAFLYKCVLKYYLDQEGQSHLWSALEERLEGRSSIPDVVNGSVGGDASFNSVTLSYPTVSYEQESESLIDEEYESLDNESDEVNTMTTMM